MPGPLLLRMGLFFVEFSAPFVRRFRAIQARWVDLSMIYRRRPELASTIHSFVILGPPSSYSQALRATYYDPTTYFSFRTPHSLLRIGLPRVTGLRPDSVARAIQVRTAALSYTIRTRAGMRATHSRLDGACIGD